MKKSMTFLMAACLVLSVASCKSNKGVATQDSLGRVKVEQPCVGAKYASDETYFRASGQGISTQQQVARDKALAAARAELSTSIEATIKRVTDNYNSSYGVGEDDETRSKFQDLTRQIVDQTLKGAVPMCDELYKEGDKYYSYICVELKGENLAEKLKKGISADEKLRTDYEYEKFKKEFDKEMKKGAGE